MTAAEDVFGADSRAVTAALRSLRPRGLHPDAVTALDMFDIAHRFLGSVADAVSWFLDHPARTTTRIDRSTTRHVVGLARGDSSLPLPEDVDNARRKRATVLATYRALLPADTASAVLDSLLHMHHNRATGVEPGSERACRHLARQAALALRAQHAATR